MEEVFWSAGLDVRMVGGRTPRSYYPSVQWKPTTLFCKRRVCSSANWEPTSNGTLFRKPTRGTLTLVGRMWHALNSCRKELVANLRTSRPRPKQAQISGFLPLYRNPASLNVLLSELVQRGRSQSRPERRQNKLPNSCCGFCLIRCLEHITLC